MEFPNYLTLLFDSYNLVYEPKVLRSEFESGIAKQSRIQCRSYKLHTAKYCVCSVDDLNSFYSWLNNDINGGASWFFWQDPTNSGEVVRARLRPNEIKITPLENTFSKWEISLSIEVWSE